MKRISGMTTTDQHGISRSIEWYQGNQKIRYVLRKSGDVTHNLGMSKDKVRKVFRDVMDVREHMAEREKVERAVPEVNQLDFSTRLQLLNDLSSSFSEQELQRMGEQDLVRKPAKVIRMSGISGNKKDWEKTSEDVLQMVWNNFQEDWFTSREFIEEYNNNFDRNKARNQLLRLHKNNDLVREPVDKDEVEDGRINYKYKLSAWALKQVSRFNGFAVENNPAFAKKNAMIQG